MRATRDILPPDVTRIVVDDEAAATRVEEALRRMTPPAEESPPTAPSAPSAPAALEAPLTQVEAMRPVIAPEADSDEPYDARGPEAAACATDTVPTEPRRGTPAPAPAPARVPWTPPRVERH